MKAREQAIRALANRLVDSFINDGHAEFIGQFTYPLSLETILRLLGIPQNHMEEVKEWGRNMTDLLFGSLESEERQVECAKGFVAFQHYVADLVEQRRQHPQNDELDALINYQVPGAEPLSQLELVNAVTGFLTVGHRTTLDACGNGFKLLLQNPELWQTLCVQPELIPATVEEIIRYEPSVQTLSRITTQEVVIGNVTLPAGAKLLILLGSANRDEQHIPNAHTFDIHRNPNHHIAFGHGIHFCVGAPAARLEMRIALETFTQRLPTLRLAPDQTFSYNPLLIFRGLQKLDVIW
jgi:cytochrome P450